MSRFLNVAEAAALFRVRPSTIYKWSMNDTFPARKHGGKLAFSLEELEEWSRSRRKQKPDPSLSRFQQVRERLRSLKTQRNEPPTLILQEGVG